MNNNSKATGAAITGVCVAMAAGTAAYMMAGKNRTKINTKRMKKTAGKAIRAVGDVVDNFSNYMR